MDFSVHWGDHEPSHRSGPMTARANSLTARDSSRRDTGNGRWSMTTGDVRVFLQAMARLGYDSEALLEGAGAQASDLDDPDGRVSCETVGTIVSLAQRARRRTALALHAAGRESDRNQRASTQRRNTRRDHEGTVPLQRRVHHLLDGASLRQRDGGRFRGRPTSVSAMRQTMSARSQPRCGVR